MTGKFGRSKDLTPPQRTAETIQIELPFFSDS